MHVLCTPCLNAFGGSVEVQINTPTMIYMLIGSYVPTHKVLNQVHKMDKAQSIGIPQTLI
jgi:hypothetical protein